MVCPSSSPIFRRPLPSDGSPGMGSPPSSVLWSDPSPCCPSRVTSLPSFGGTCPCARPLSGFCSRSSVARFPAGLGHFCPAPRITVAARMEATRVPRFLGSPCQRAAFSDPGGPPTPGHTASVMLPSANSKTSAPQQPISGLNHAAHWLAVYASQCGSLRSHARLASGRGPALPGWVCPTRLQ